MSNLPFIAYSQKNKNYARENRKQQTKAETIIREKLLRKKQTGFIFLRQKMIGPYILDFYCSYLLLGIEIDGSSHVGKEVYDEVRTNYLLDKGIEIIRYTNIDVYNCIEEVHQDLISRLHKKEKTKELYT